MEQRGANDVAPGGSLLDAGGLRFLKAVGRLCSNPFDPRWDQRLCDALGPERLGGVEDGEAVVWGPLGSAKDRLSEPVADVLGWVARRLGAGATLAAGELSAYRGAAVYGLWDRFGAPLQEVIDAKGVDAPFYDDFLRAHRVLFDHPGLSGPEPAHLFDLLYQLRRACWFITEKIAGRSRAACLSRAAILRAIAGNDVCFYARELYRRMDEFPVLITGETGTGKDLAAECIGWSRYIHCDPATRRFKATYAEDFLRRNLCEVPDDLQESALFGHKKGSFTGAVSDALGCFALLRANATLFLDEIGELPPHLQAMLLRPLQNHEYVPLGESRPHSFEGRLIFATNRDLEALCRRGEFRADLYQRMNGLRVHMPPLRELRADGGLLEYVGRFVADKIDDPDLQCLHTIRVMRKIQNDLADYDWPGNLRELKNYTERCLLEGSDDEGDDAGADASAPGPASRAPASLAAAERRRSAAPAAAARRRSAEPTNARPPESICQPSSGTVGPRAKAGLVDHKALIRSYVTRIYVLTGQNLAETARITGFDRRTVRRWIDPVLLARLLGESK